MIKKYLVPVGVLIGLLQAGLYFDEKNVAKGVFDSVSDYTYNLTLGFEIVSNAAASAFAESEDKYENQTDADTEAAEVPEVSSPEVEVNVKNSEDSDASVVVVEEPADVTTTTQAPDVATDKTEVVVPVTKEVAIPKKTQKETPSNALQDDSEKERIYYEYNFRKMTELVNISTLMDWNRDRRSRGKYRGWLDAFDYEELYKTDFNVTAIANSDKMIFKNDAYSLCAFAKAMTEYHVLHPNTPKPHVLLGRLNQDFGSLSSRIPGKTGKFAKLPQQWESEGCTTEFIMDYLNHPDTLAVFTIQFQVYKHPKVISIPLGLSAGGNSRHHALRKHINTFAPAKNRTQLLMINSQVWSGRGVAIAKIMENFKDYEYGAPQNTYKKYKNTDCPYEATMDCYYWEMKKSKFVLSPSGLGVDCYRTWEALYLGAIPVIERVSENDGWFDNTLANLPIAWVDDFTSVTPAFLQETYDRMIHRTPPTAYHFEKLTRQYWHEQVYSVLEDHERKVAESGGTPKKIVRLKLPPSFEEPGNPEIVPFSTEIQNDAGHNEEQPALEQDGREEDEDAVAAEPASNGGGEDEEEALSATSIPASASTVADKQWSEVEWSALGRAEREEIFYTQNHRKLTSLINMTTLMDWNRDRRKKGKYRQWLDHFDYEDLGKDVKASQIANSTKMIFRYDPSLCGVALAFHEFRVANPNTPKPHILLARLNQDFGALSTFIKGKTGPFGDLVKKWSSQGCSPEFVMDYINHPETLKIFTNQFQEYNIPKVVSLPLGLSSGGKNTLMKSIHAPQLNRTKYLMINAKEWVGRAKSIAKIRQSFRAYGVRNTYKNYASTDCPYDPVANITRCYFWEMQRSKFVLSPSGLGLDCYRTWEALYLGAIPVLERLGRTEDGWFLRTFEDLPIAWIDDYNDLTPEYLEKEYERIVHQTPISSYKQEKLTRQYWIQMAHSVLEDYKQKAASGVGTAA